MIVSSDTSQSVELDKTYKMKIRLSKATSGKDFPMYSLPQAFGPAVDASFSPPKSSDGIDFVSANNAFHVTRISRSPDFIAHGYSAYTPPHFDSLAEVEYTFTPDETENYESSNPAAIETIINKITFDNKTTPTIKYNRLIKATGSYAGPSFTDMIAKSVGGDRNEPPIIVAGLRTVPHLQQLLHPSIKNQQCSFCKF